jgi:carbamoyl-phosphate synthase large subunit
MFPEVDPVLGPEMRSTGEVLGMADSFGMAFYKAQEAAQSRLPSEGTVLITVNDRDKAAVLETARQLETLGFKILATMGTHKFLVENGVGAELTNKLHENRPHLADAMHNGDIHLVINTPAGKYSATDDSYIRKAAIRYKIPYITTAAAAFAAARGIAAHKQGKKELKSLQEYHAELTTDRLKQTGPEKV